MRNPTPRQSHRRAILLGLLALILGTLIVPLAAYLYAGPALAAQAPATAPTNQGAVPEVHDSGTWNKTNPRSHYWREVRGGDTGYTAVTGRAGDGVDVLIQARGQEWRLVRNGYVSTYGPWFLLVVVLALGLFFILRGPVRLDEPRSGRTVTRWSGTERLLHWATATLFVIMAFTGLSIFFGRAVIRPWLGATGFAVWAEVSKVVHNYAGVLFTACILLMIVAWIRNNLPERSDWEWLKRGGGMLRKGRHVPAGRVNAGEKMWFWFIAIAGLAVCVTGLIFDFPNFGDTRATMQTANIIHSVLAIVWVGIFFGHVYIGTIGTEGALEGMTRGEVSVEWAKQHHELWYREVTGGRQPESTSGKVPGSAPS